MSTSDPKKGEVLRSRERIERRVQTLLAAAATSVTIAGCGSGYGVVDPMPPPARCPGLAGVIEAVATWKTVNGQRIIGVTLKRPANRPDVAFEGTAPIYASGGAIQAFQSGEMLTFDFAPNAEPSTPNVTIALHCQEGPQRIFLVLALDSDAGAPTDGAAVKVSLSDN